METVAIWNPVGLMWGSCVPVVGRSPVPWGGGPTTQPRPVAAPIIGPTVPSRALVVATPPVRVVPVSPVIGMCTVVGVLSRPIAAFPTVAAASVSAVIVGSPQRSTVLRCLARTYVHD